MPTNRGIFLKDDIVVQETFISERSRSCRKMFKVAYMETEQMDSAYRMETTKIPSAFKCILKYLGL